MNNLLEPIHSETYKRLARSLNSFVEITQIDALFFSLSGVLVNDGTVSTDSKIIQHAIDPASFGKYIIFPIILNDQIWGFTMCNSAKSSHRRLQLSKEYLSNLFSSIFTDFSGSSSEVLDPLTKDQLTQINFLSTLLQLKSTTHAVSVLPDPEVPISSEKVEAIQSIQYATEYICKNLNSSLTLDSVANHVFLSSSYLSRIFKKYMHVNFINYVNHQKIAQSQLELILTRTPINLISNNAGFTQTSYFTKTLKKITGVTPSIYRKKNINVKKIYTIPHTVNWNRANSVFDVSKAFFKENKLDYYYESTDGFLYVNSIGELTDSGDKSGWVFTVDGQQPSDSADLISSKDKSVIQWMYVEFDNF
ncbi:helix-turn-helix domain-containing protein [Pediococcus claussenii]|uniref:Transcriptional regulator, AraC family n=1 Tax=Pediococcus claussenii (strain ATCC BAA-344 / DSM 14800 / JCM 18046 / KCTC 3811 / LMG 21948 / P06) TaxID=701521 RepID=G8PEW8_PEDCP|nr:helix-turn-helix domain-containing protein [Pediococcus claussenii]AEV95647.1 transcriptional regulator, AraC family [Pediococcus claussenii ATCC BAA-344]ANZ69166.1 transcriptional regulator [Pediococcus claussenii]ANZ70983.1 transcriptional regulator [Pediococcus claussenii]KRN20120.1 hypothetical protein IV79_GL000785 [Pediococcus claussenii]